MLILSFCFFDDLHNLKGQFPFDISFYSNFIVLSVNGLLPF